MSSIVTITVTGPTGCGKSAICGEIEIALKAIGLDVVWHSGKQEKNMTGADWAGALDLYCPRVVIEEVNEP